jgi:ABC-type ATPase with predicted acetyltransferase domain
MLLSVSHSFLPKRPGVRASIVMDHFGIDFEQGRHVIADNLELPIEPGQIVLFTGPSGSGKSSLMRAAADALAQLSPLNSPLSVDALPLSDALLIESLPLPVEEAMGLLSLCGLGEAHLMLRTPAELSDGQRYRFRLSLALARQPRWIVADEFTAALDRTLAKVIAFNVRRLSRRRKVGFLLATTHEDVSADLAPDLHMRCRLDGEIVVERGTINTTESIPDAASIRDAVPAVGGGE